MKVYLAGPYVARDYLRGVTVALGSQGVLVTSSWLHESADLADAGTHGAAKALTDDEVREHVLTDLRDIEAADALVIFTASAITAALPRLAATPHLLTSGGRHVEMGYALAHRLAIYLVGEPENVFQRACATRIPTAARIADALRG